MSETDACHPYDEACGKSGPCRNHGGVAPAPVDGVLCLFCDHVLIEPRNGGAFVYGLMPSGDCDHPKETP